MKTWKPVLFTCVSALFFAAVSAHADEPHNPRVQNENERTRVMSAEFVELRGADIADAVVGNENTGLSRTITATVRDPRGFNAIYVIVPQNIDVIGKLSNHARNATKTALKGSRIYVGRHYNGQVMSAVYNFHPVAVSAEPIR